jgi:transcriptional regulator with GAF, ATPase, and Fis domain
MEAGDAEQLRRERDLYLRLLELGTQSEVHPLLRDALALVVELTGANHGYLELGDERLENGCWSMADGFTDAEVERVRSVISRGIIAEVVARGETIITASALLDARFQERESVQMGRIEAVLCVPVGADPPVGVVYLQGRKTRGPFSAVDRANAEIFARHLAPIVHRLLLLERQRPDPTTRFRKTLRCEGVIGRSPALATVLRQVALVAPLDVSVLLMGQSGTGKSQVARVIHDNGPRAGHPFVELNCAALPEALVESELFGALPGAHSTAARRIEGKVAAAEKGTLLLDEVGELPLSAQAKLLQVLQSKRYYPLGSSKSLSADVRLIAATNSDLQAAVAERRFREDLFYRLQVFALRIPSLAERTEDVRDLAVYFLAQACERHRLPHLELSTGGLSAAASAAWPGNARQLANAIESAAIRAAGEGSIAVEQEHLFPRDFGADAKSEEAATFQEATRRFQARLLRGALEAADWNVMEVVKRLDLARSHVYNLIRAFGLKRSD